MRLCNHVPTEQIGTRLTLRMRESFGVVTLALALALALALTGAMVGSVVWRTMTSRFGLVWLLEFCSAPSPVIVACGKWKSVSAAIIIDSDKEQELGQIKLISCCCE